MRKIIYVVESRKWVQYERILIIKKLQSKFNFLILTSNEFYYLWIIGFFRNKPIIFSTWRLIISLQNKKKNIFSDNNFKYFLASITSHSNLNDVNLSKQKQKEQFAKAIIILLKSKLVTVNSKILFKLLKSHINKIYYCPNGVDNLIFYPNKIKKISSPISIGIVGKDRLVKNLKMFDLIKKHYKDNNNLIFHSIVTPRSFKGLISKYKISNFYRSIDFYLCLSHQEGTPNTALEAGSCGIPIISTYVGNMPELIINEINGYLINGSFKSITNLLDRLIKLDNTKYLSLSKNISKTINCKWLWDKQIKNFIIAYDYLVDN